MKMNPVIKVLAKRCRMLICELAILSIIAVPMVWLSSQATILSVWTMIVGIQNPLMMLTPDVRLLGVVISLLPLAVILYIARLLITLFKNYEQSNILTLANARLIRKLGFSLYLCAASNIIFKTLLSLILTFNNPPHSKLLTVSISGADIQSVVIGSIIILLSWVMIEAQKISEDSALIP